MNRLLTWAASRGGRKRIYQVALAGVPLLVAYGYLEQAKAPLVIALAGAILAPSMALANLPPKDSDD